MSTYKAILCLTLLGLSPTWVCLGEKIIPVQLEPDDLFAPAAIAMMTSLFENAKSNTFYQVYIFIPSNFKNENRMKIVSMQGRYRNCEINFIDMGHLFEEYSSFYFTPSTLFDSRAAGTLTNHTKCIHLDCDVLIRHDLSEMYDINMDNYYYAGVYDLGVRKNYKRAIRPPNFDQYICVGIMLMNLEKIREDKLEDKYFRLFESNTKNTMFESDSINSFGYGKLLVLPLRFSFLANFLKISASYQDIGKAKLYISPDEWKAKDPITVHFNNNPKPWGDHSKTIFHEEYWVYAKKAGIDRELEEMNSRRNALTEENYKKREIERRKKRGKKMGKIVRSLE